MECDYLYLRRSRLGSIPAEINTSQQVVMKTKEATSENGGAHHQQDFVFRLPEAIRYIQRRLRPKERVEAADGPTVDPEQAGCGA